MITNPYVIVFATFVASVFFTLGSDINNINIIILGFIPTVYLLLCAVEYLRWNPNKSLTNKPCIICDNQTLLKDYYGKPECLDCYKKRQTEND